MRRYARKDSNQDEIVTALRSVGCTVQSLASVGGGCPDLLVAIYGKNYLLEVKDGAKPPSARALTAEEAVWHREWKGRVTVVNDVRSALEAVGVQVQ